MNEGLSSDLSRLRNLNSNITTLNEGIKCIASDTVNKMISSYTANTMFTLDVALKNLMELKNTREEAQLRVKMHSERFKPLAFGMGMLSIGGAVLGTVAITALFAVPFILFATFDTSRGRDMPTCFRDPYVELVNLTLYGADQIKFCFETSEKISQRIQESGKAIKQIKEDTLNLLEVVKFEKISLKHKEGIKKINELYKKIKEAEEEKLLIRNKYNVTEVLLPQAEPSVFLDTVNSVGIFTDLGKELNELRQAIARIKDFPSEQQSNPIVSQSVMQVLEDWEVQEI